MPAGRDAEAQPAAILVVDDVHAVGTWKTTLIQVWRGAPTGPLSAEVNEITKQFMQASSGPINCLFVVERGSPPPDEACRKNLATFSRDLVSRMGIAVVVSEGSSFRAALVRAVGVTLTTILPHSSKFKFVGDLETAAKLIAPHLGPGADNARGLTSAVEDLRSKIASPTPI